MDRLAGKTAVVTGAGRGIGRAIARLFAAEGAHVVLISRRAESCGAAAEAINAEYPGSCTAMACDVATSAAVEECARNILAAFPNIDILVNNAGITRDSLVMRMKEEDWDAVLDTNLKSAFLASKALMRTLMKSSAGRIINITSVVGLSGNAGQANYAASKAGIIGLTKSLAKEIAGRKVTVNAIAPGFIGTEMTLSLPESVREDILRRIPLGCIAEPEDVAQCALFLASDAARYVTGQVLACDGGMSM